jgi:hypothetical protein
MQKDRISALSALLEPLAARGEPASPPSEERLAEALRQALAADVRPPRAQRRTARALYAELKAAGYSGGYA